MSRIGRRSLVVALTVVGLVLAMTVSGLPFYVFPQVDRRQNTDVIFVLGPSLQSRVSIAESMAAAGLTQQIVVSVPHGGSPDKATQDACSGRTSYRVLCFTPSPFTTEGEAEYLTASAKSHGWRKVTVITATYHVTRSRYIISKCFDGDLIMINDPAPLTLDVWAAQYIYQTAAFIKALGRDCSS